MGELANKLGVDTSADPITLIEQGKGEIAVGNHQKAKQIFEQAIQIAGDQTVKYLQQSQHRAAAQALYAQALGNENLGKTEERDNLYAKVADELIKAGDNALAFGEDNRGMASAALAGMVCLMYDNQDKAFQIYNDYVNKAQDKPNTDYLKKLLYSLGYLLDAVRNENVAALTDAQNYISTDLRPMLSTAKLGGFENLLNNVVQYTRSILERRITMPNIKINTGLPKDIQFNQLFTFNLSAVNEGDGKASTVELEIELPSDLELVDGDPKATLEVLESTQSINKSLSLRFQTGDATGSQVRDIKGSLTFIDMLGNSHKQFFGPIQIEFTATSKKEEFQQQLDTISTPLTDGSMSQAYADIPNELILEFIAMGTTMKSDITETIQEEKFEAAEVSLSLYQNLMNWMADFANESPIATKVATAVSTNIEVAKTQVQQELQEKYEAEKTAALDSQRTELDTKYQQEMTDQKTQLEQKFNSEMTELKTGHQKEMQQLTSTQENRLKQQLAHLESKLKEEHGKEVEQINSRNEEVIRDLQKQEMESVENTDKKVREEMEEKYEKKLSEMQDTMAEQERQLTSRYEQQKEIELNTLQQKLEREKTEALDAQERELSERLRSEYNEKVREKDQEITRLKDQILKLQDDSQPSMPPA